jgi:uncharacterized protein YndB with AHSA1/START domain
LSNEILQTTPDCEIVCTRDLNFNRELIFKAWSEPEHLKIWWGPAGFTNTFNLFEFKEGGKWNFVMHGPEKGNYVNECEFIRIIHPSLIAWKRYSPPLFQVLVTFDILEENKTKVVFKQLFTSASECAKIKRFVEDKNEENFDRLEILLNSISQNQ